MNHRHVLWVHVGFVHRWPNDALSLSRDNETRDGGAYRDEKFHGDEARKYKFEPQLQQARTGLPDWVKSNSIEQHAKIRPNASPHDQNGPEMPRCALSM